MKFVNNTLKNMENKDFAVFIMVHDRPNNCYTYKTLKRAGYTGKIYLICDNDSKYLNEYLKNFGSEVISFDKISIIDKYDSGDNSGNLASTMYKANESFNLAKDKGLKYFCLMCDDYYCISYRYDTGSRIIKNNMDSVFDNMINFHKSTNIKTIAFSQGGDHIGGFNSKFRRKSMNSFFCSTDRRFVFSGRLNEDVTTYTLLGSQGDIFCTFPHIQLDQKDTQKTGKGLSESYILSGTYVKSFFSVMYNPSNTKVSIMNANNPRLHHSIKWINTTPMIIQEKYKKNN